MDVDRRDEEIVISGISGRFPQSGNMDEFSKNLFDGVDMVTDDSSRFPPGIYGLPGRSGKIKELDKFDAQFFAVHPKQSQFMDPQLRILLEVTHEAIVDAGINPVNLRGTETGVFVGATDSDSLRHWLQNPDPGHGYAITGCSRSMFSNRISYSFDFKGPSFSVDSACSASLVALEQAVTAIKMGHCDAAVVGGVQLNLDPKIALQYHNLKMLSPEGKCQSYDADGNGYVRSEAVVAIFIQRAKTARRSYATILAARTKTDGWKEKGITFPSGEEQKNLLVKVYQEAGVDPKNVVYLETHGTGTAAGDPQELNAIADVFCKDRPSDQPLLIGSVKSNMGHGEHAAGLCNIAKILIAIQQGKIPGNLYFKTPNPDVLALADGRLKVVAENLAWDEEDDYIIGLNSFGYGGSNVHAIFKANAQKPKFSKNSEKLPFLKIPVVIPFSSRTEDSVEVCLREIIQHFGPEQISLVHHIFQDNIPGHHYRGYGLIEHRLKTDHLNPAPDFDRDQDLNLEVTEMFQSPSSSQRPVWFIFNGMGSQWTGMGRPLLNFPVCKDSLEKSASVLLTSHKFDLFFILEDHSEGTFENVLNAFVGITAIQLALVDLLRSLNIYPTGIIGHSIGELVAAYTDDCMTSKQVILAAFARGQAILEVTDSINEESPQGRLKMGMAAVGLSWQEALEKCPPGIYPACHNSKDSVTISGPVKDISVFLKNLQNQGIFAKEVNSSGQAFHSKYIEPAVPKFKQYLENIISVPQPRSSRWISSSVPQDQWDSPLGQFSSADYHVNNLRSPVLFQEALEKVPESAIVIEIGPHSLLQAVLKRSLPNCKIIGLLNKHLQDHNSTFLCKSLGKLYNAGLNPHFQNLYPKIEFPVTAFGNGPSLSALASTCWDHSQSWQVAKFQCQDENGKVYQGGNNSLENSKDGGQHEDPKSEQVGSEFAAQNQTVPKLTEQVAKILGMKPKEVGKQRTGTKLSDLGMDSLMTIEVQQEIQLSAGIVLTQSEVLDLTFDTLRKMELKLDTINHHTGNFENDAKTKDDCLPSKNKTDHSSYQMDDQNCNDNNNNNNKNDNCSAKPQKRKTRISRRLLYSILYLYQMSTLFNMFMTWLASLILRQVTIWYLRFFHNYPLDIKLMDRPLDAILATNPQRSNSILVIKFSGLPAKEKIVRRLEHVIELQTNISFVEQTGYSKNPPLYSPYEILKWRPSPGWLFFYWARDKDFSIENHVTLKTLPPGADLKKETTRLCETVHCYKWNKNEDEDRPPWRIFILAPTYEEEQNGENSNLKKPPIEFTIIFVHHHSFGDGLSLFQMLQYALPDQKLDAPRPTAAPTKKRENLVTFFKKIHQKISAATHVWMHHVPYRNSRYPGNVKPGRRWMDFWSFPLSDIKKVKNPETGQAVSLNVFILVCLSKTYEVIYQYRRQNYPGEKSPPKRIVVGLPFVIRPYRQLGLVNNVSANYMHVPIETLDPDPEYGLTGQGSKIKFIQDSLAKGGRPESLEAFWAIAKIVSTYPRFLPRLVHTWAPLSHVSCSAVPINVPRHFTFFEGHEALEVYGSGPLIGGSHVNLTCLVDSQRDSVQISLAADESAIDLCPDFVPIFFRVFQEQLDLLGGHKGQNFQNEVAVTRL